MKQTATNLIRCIGKWALCIFLSGQLSMPAVAQAPTPSSVSMLTVDKAVEIALAQSPTVMIQDVSFVKQQYAQRSDWATLYPSVDISGNYGYTLKKQRMYFDGFPGAEAMPGMEDGIEMGRTHNIQAGISVGLPLINAQLWEKLALSREQVELSWMQAKNSRADLEVEVRKAFYSALLAKESVAVLSESFANARQNYKSVQDKYQQGLVAQYDLLRAEVAMNNLEPNLLQAQSAANLARKQLFLLMGLELDQQDIVLDGDLEDLGRNISVYEMQESELNRNPNLLLLQKQGSMLQHSINLSKYSFFPTVNLGGNYMYSFSSNKLDLDNKKLWVPHSVVSLSISIPIFSGGKRINSVRTARAEHLIHELRTNDTRKQLSLAAKSQWEQITTSLKKIDANKRAIETAQQGYTIASKRYDTGMGTQLELDDARLQLLQAQLSLKQTQHELLIANTELNKLRGAYSQDLQPNDLGERLDQIRKNTALFPKK